MSKIRNMEITAMLPQQPKFKRPPQLNAWQRHFAENITSTWQPFLSCAKNKHNSLTMEENTNMFTFYGPYFLFQGTHTFIKNINYHFEKSLLI